jgi:hypothetical protein
MILQFTDFTPPLDTDDYVIATDRDTISYVITEDGEIKQHESGDKVIAVESDYIIRFNRSYILDLIKKQLIDGIIVEDNTVIVNLRDGGTLTGRLDPIIIDDVPKKLPDYFS